MTGPATSSAADRAADRRRTVRSVALVTVLAVAVPVVITVVFGSFGHPHNDDWAYQEILDRWASGGGYVSNGYETTFLAGQLAVAWPVAKLFPGSFTALQTLTIGLGLVGVLALWWTLRRFLSPGRATLAVVLMTVTPLWAPLAASFMTDVPALAAQVVCLALGAAALGAGSRSTRIGLVLGAMAAGLLGATIREIAIVAPASVLGVLVLRAAARRDRRELVGLVASGLGFAGAFAILFVWRRSLPNTYELEPQLTSDIGEWGRSAMFLLVTLAFLVLPAMAFVPWRALRDTVTRRPWRTVVAGGALAALLVGVVTTWVFVPPLLQQYVDQRGATEPPALPGEWGLLLPTTVFKALLAVVMVTAIGLVVIVATSSRELAPDGLGRSTFATLDTRALVWFYVVVHFAALVLSGVAVGLLYDRYLIGIAPLTVGLMLAWRGRGALPLFASGRRRAGQAVAVGVFAAIGLYFSANTAAFNDARWRAGAYAVALGHRPDRVDVGADWRNVQRPPGSAVVTNRAAVEEKDYCVTAVMGGPTVGALAVVEPTWPFGSIGEIVLFDHPERPGCDGSPSG